MDKLLGRLSTDHKLRIRISSKLSKKWADGAPEPSGLGITVTRESDNKAVAFRAVNGPGYVLLVLQAGTYDVRVVRTGRDPVVLSKVEVPVDRTRMKLVP